MPTSDPSDPSTQRSQALALLQQKGMTRDKRRVRGPQSSRLTPVDLPPL